MRRHHKRELRPTGALVKPDPVVHVVYDVHGMPVGVRIGGAERHDDATPASRYHARITALRKTRELEGREWITLGLF